MSTVRDGVVYYVGTDEEVAHHARPLADRMEVHIVAPEKALERATPGDVTVFYNEYFERFRAACMELVARGCPTLYAIDGILEWRNSWEFPGGAGSCLQTMRPVLAHKVACIGRSQARTLESWGNLGRCEVVGIPRFDALSERRPRRRDAAAPFRVLVMTAKTPGYTVEQWERTRASLADLKACFDERANSDAVPPIEPIWRLTAGLAEAIGVENSLGDTKGAALASALDSADAAITTPSTAMLECMLRGLPTALLDYHNCPHYVPAAWTVSARERLAPTIAELLDPPSAKMVYQNAVLHDALECRTPATPRLAELIEAMSRTSRDCRERGRPLSFPRRILDDEADGHHLPEERFDLRTLYPDHPVFSDMDRAALQAEVGHLRLELAAAQKAHRPVEEKNRPGLLRRLLRRFS